MWSRTYGGTGDEAAQSIIQTSDGAYAIAGYTESYGAGGSDFWLVKIDATGSPLWNKTYGGFTYDYANSLIQTSDGGYAIAGRSMSFNAGDDDVWLVKTDASGNMQWNKTYGGKYTDIAFSLVQTSDGGYAMAGYTVSYGAGGFDDYNDDALLVKTDELGNILWDTAYGGEDSQEFARSVVQTTDGGYLLAGSTNASFGAGGYDFWLVKTDGSGMMQWNKTYGGTGDEMAFCMVQTVDGGYALAGSRFLLVKTDELGNMEWNQTFAEASFEEAYSVIQTSDGGYALAGFTMNYSSGDYDFLFFKTDAIGKIQLNSTYGGTGYQGTYSVTQTSDNGYILAGYNSTVSFSDLDMWVLKTDELGMVPEYSSWLVPALVLTATAFIIINKKRLLHKR